MDIGEAVEALEEGKKVSRKSWDNPIYLFRDEEGGVFFKTFRKNEGNFLWGDIIYPRLPPDDFMAKDWYIVED